MSLFRVGWNSETPRNLMYLHPGQRVENLSGQLIPKIDLKKCGLTTIPGSISLTLQHHWIL